MSRLIFTEQYFKLWFFIRNVLCLMYRMLLVIWILVWMEVNLKEFIRKWKISIILLPLELYYCLNRGDYTLLDNADLVIHEAGHVFFYFFGQFIYMAGGTLMQILLPLLIVWFFIRSGYLTGIQFSLFWLGHNFLNISVYAGDAETRTLRLLGNGTHDWYYMLSKLGILDYSEAVGGFFFLIAMIVFSLSLATPVLNDRLA